MLTLDHPLKENFSKEFKTMVNKAIQNLYDQGEISASVVSSTSRCLYRSPNGKKCIVGWMISDEKYSPVIDQGNSGAADILGENGEFSKRYLGIKLDEQEIQFLTELQNFHDEMVYLPDDDGDKFKPEFAENIAELQEYYDWIKVPK